MLYFIITCLAIAVLALGFSADYQKSKMREALEEFESQRGELLLKIQEKDERIDRLIERIDLNEKHFSEKLDEAKSLSLRKERDQVKIDEVINHVHTVRTETQLRIHTRQSMGAFVKEYEKQILESLGRSLFEKGFIDMQWLHDTGSTYCTVRTKIIVYKP